MIKNLLSLLNEIFTLPKLQIIFKNHTNQSLEKYKQTYQYFQKLHRLKLFRNKTVGVALIDLNLYENFDEYYTNINGKNSAAYYSRKALKRGYEFIEIDRNEYLNDIYEINTSASHRQGLAMAEAYMQKKNSYQNETNYRYFGVINNENKLLAYCNIAFYGEFALVVTLLGHKKYLNDGIMYLMMIELTRLMIDSYKSKGYKYIMYDTFFGASQGLQKFKTKLGYKAYKVKWIWED